MGSHISLQPPEQTNPEFPGINPEFPGINPEPPEINLESPVIKPGLLISIQIIQRSILLILLILVSRNDKASHSKVVFFGVTLYMTDNYQKKMVCKSTK